MTETTTQPDPQVVAWMRAYLRERADARYGDVVHAYRRTHGVYQPPAWDDLYAAEEAARKPLTVADIPAGRGAASLFLMTRYRPGSARSHWQLIYKREDGTLAPQVTPAGPEDAVFAVLQHLAATLPTVTDAADPLFDTPQITTDDEGRHWHQGREYVAVDVDGELDYQPKEEGA